jgi:hypothetical protein
MKITIEQEKGYAYITYAEKYIFHMELGIILWL